MHRHDPSVASPIECEARFQPEQEGGYSAYIPSLPGVASQGETLQEAEANIIEALEGAVETYRAHNEPIPWLQEYPAKAKNEISKRVSVNG